MHNSYLRAFNMNSAQADLACIAAIFNRLVFFPNSVDRKVLKVNERIRISCDVIGAFHYVFEEVSKEEQISTNGKTQQEEII
ncbi:hypothetical protein F7734_05525 [Scytonema sp. UIC 10036]|uniref:hypothetical protein n=1 Tax=Scytonema sp. UIC 10036 TaxID=2304196 RepID=UPI0012DACA52|nr:hypothetical protein [Scytonema sp. UIC 10036]MUG91949.1 hypothetical protein [Scytonema sp. UIC 10036]